MFNRINLEIQENKIKEQTITNLNNILHKKKNELKSIGEFELKKEIKKIYSFR